MSEQGNAKSQIEKDLDYYRGKWRESEQRVDELSSQTRKLETASKSQSEKEEAFRNLESQMSETLSKKDAELESLKAKLAEVEQAERSRVASRFDNLPEANRAKLEPLREKLDLKDWATLVDQESAQFENAEPEPTPEAEAQVATPPPVGGGMRRAPSRNEYEPTPQASRILDEHLMRDDSMLRSLSVRKDPESGQTKFFVPVREMYDRMLKKPITNVSAKGLVER